MQKISQFTVNLDTKKLVLYERLIGFFSPYCHLVPFLFYYNLRATEFYNKKNRLKRWEENGWRQRSAWSNQVFKANFF